MQLSTSPALQMMTSSPAFAGPRVRLDEQPWSPALAERVSAWAERQPTMVVLADGKALVGGPGPRAPFGERLRREWEFAHRAGMAELPAPAIGQCAVFKFHPDSLASAPSRADDGAGMVQLAPAALFRFYWRLRALALGCPSPVEQVEADALALLHHAMLHAWPCGRPSQSEAGSRHRSLALAAQAIMSRSLAPSCSLAAIARELDTSPFHLAHVFRRQVGLSMHQYLVRLRIIAALTRLRAGSPDLSQLALELGFSHHSHFSSQFRRIVGHTPRDVRRMLHAETLAELGVTALPCGAA